VDRNSRIHSREAHPLPPNSRADPPWLHQSQAQKTDQNTCIVIYWTLHLASFLIQR